MNLEEKLYTSTEVAQILGVSLRSVYRYLEEGKLDAEVKTATGRHRFTKQNILDFLYPNKDNQPEQKEVKSDVPKVQVAEEKKSKPQTQTLKETPKPVEEETAVDEEPVDWLAKFREAANKFKTEETSEPAVAAASFQEQAPVKDDFTGLGNFSAEPEVEKEPENKQFYYRSMLGGLKDIAQNIDKSARKSSVDYAFTLNAGLSLHKPIKPFSMLHVYVKGRDKELFEKMLQLVPSEKDTAQVCLIVSDDSNVYKNSKELHGLYVVSDMQLKSDLASAGEDELARSLETDFPF
ncbi:MAG TPA: helix-turn-helix domain-containing protein [Candidatus Saccharimonadales bacterium]|nr:helix-turn-helix domain-containing protein [Candidatus Saccharimonadales bacterium]